MFLLMGCEAMTSIKKKICLLGSFAVGKTSLVERFVHDRFEDKYLTTVGVKISTKLMPPVESPGSGRFIQHTFLIWDIAGLEKFDRVALNYFRGGAGALAVADLTVPETIDRLHEFCEKFISVSDNESPHRDKLKLPTISFAPSLPFPSASYQVFSELFRSMLILLFLSPPFVL